MNITRLITLLSALYIFAGQTAWASPQAKEKQLVYVLTLHDEINAKTWQYTKRACDEAREHEADMLLVYMNTYGGALDAADSIRTALIDTTIPTIAFIDHNAASAGALIALACDSVYMSPGASMGAATVVNQEGKPLPDKYQSYMKSIMRATAEHHGKDWNDEDSTWRWRRDPAIAESMVTPSEAISFTASEAIKAGYADGSATSIDNLLKENLGIDYRLKVFSPTATDDIIGFLGNAAVQAVLIMIIIGGIYFELHTPGMGFAAAAAIVATILYFLPMLITGTMAPWVVIIFIAGIVLLALEIFVIPGFGVAGVLGIIGILSSLTGAMLNGSIMDDSSINGLARALCITTTGIVLAVALIIYLTSRHGPKFIRRTSELQLSQNISDGYIGVDMTIARCVGRTGITVTELRPSGKVKIDGCDYDAVSLSGFVDAGTQVDVVRFENAQLYVKTNN